MLEPESHLAPTIFACGINPESVDEVASLSDHEIAWALFESCLSFMGSFSPAVFREEASGREGRQSSGPNTERDETWEKP